MEIVISCISKAIISNMNTKTGNEFQWNLLSDFKKQFSEKYFEKILKWKNNFKFRSEYIQLKLNK